MGDGALEMVAGMVLDNGRTWGECATGDQWADMEALLEPGDGPRKHFWLRARGRSKTWDAAAATLAVMITRARPGDEMYVAAAGKDQAALLVRKIQAITDATPSLRGLVEVQQRRVIARRTGAVLEVISSELEGAWGKTPFWLFIDEVCNHGISERDWTFIDALITSMVKRPGSVLLIGSTPSAVTHWSYRLWQNALEDPLWRTSIVTGPAPWQDPAELASERRRLPEFQWLRLFECRWAAADDALADDAALAACTRDGMLAPEHGAEYVVTFDLGLKKDHSAVSVAHAGDRDRRRAVIVDRLYGWVPPRGGQVDLGAVLGTAGALSREYGGAPIVGDPWQAADRIQEMAAGGWNIREVRLGAGASSRRAQILMRLIRDRAIEIPDDDMLRREFLSLRLAEGSTPGVVTLRQDGSSLGHFDRVTAIMYAAEWLLSRPSSSWKDYCGKTRSCQACGKVYLAARQACIWCAAPNPEAPEAPEAVRGPLRTASVAAAPQPGSWASAYLPADARKCAAGHVYAGGHGEDCPRCARSGGGSGGGLPPAFARALAVRIR